MRQEGIGKTFGSIGRGFRQKEFRLNTLNFHNSQFQQMVELLPVCLFDSTFSMRLACTNADFRYSWGNEYIFKENKMAITAGAVHHFALTVTDTARSKEFYMSVLGLNQIADLGGGRVLVGNESLIFAIGPPPDNSQALENDRFSEHRCGLDHVSFTVESLAVLEEAVKMFDEKGISHGEIKDLSEGGFPIYVLAFRDPDNIQLEFTAPKS